MLRQAVASDIAGIQHVRRSVRENRLVSTVISDDQVREAIERTGRGWIIESRGEVVAFAVGNAASGNIWALFVHPDHERRGYGRLLHDTMIDWLCSQGLRRLWFTTEPGREQFRVGLVWVALTVAFELGLGAALGYTTERMLSDYDLAEGGLMGLGLVFLLFAPMLAAKARRSS